MSNTPTRADDDVSPMEAQNTGPAHEGPAKEPPREDRAGPEAHEREEASARMMPGREAATRDDL